MKKQSLSGRTCIAILLLIPIFFFILDGIIASLNPMVNTYYFNKNDFEKNRTLHPEKVYDKVFFGNSVLISSYKEKASRSGFIEFGLAYGKITDLKAMLDEKLIQVDSELVIALNYFVFMDTLDTNPNYIWHKKPYEPYLYFTRNRMKTMVTDAFEDVMSLNFKFKKYPDLTKEICYGMMTDEELNERIQVHSDLYWGLSLDSFQDNFDALKWIVDYCEANEIKLRAVWMPWNPYHEMPEISHNVMESANAIFDINGIEVLNLTENFSRECFYDMGHLNYERGANEFTKEIDLWL